MQRSDEVMRCVLSTPGATSRFLLHMTMKVYGGKEAMLAIGNEVKIAPQCLLYKSVELGDHRGNEVVACSEHQVQPVAFSSLPSI